jgi:hypothetical protein
MSHVEDSIRHHMDNRADFVGKVHRSNGDYELSSTLTLRPRSERTYNAFIRPSMLERRTKLAWILASANSATLTPQVATFLAMP